MLNRQRSRRVAGGSLARFLRRLSAVAPAARADSLAVSLVSDRRIRDYNREFRGRDRPTDVLSFPARGRAAPRGERHLGDIVISVPSAAVQARRAGHSLPRELKLLALHGYLHLLGYDHERDGGAMRRLERRLERRLLPRRGAPPPGR